MNIHLCSCKHTYPAHLATCPKCHCRTDAPLPLPPPPPLPLSYPPEPLGPPPVSRPPMDLDTARYELRRFYNSYGPTSFRVHMMTTLLGGKEAVDRILHPPEKGKTKE